MKGQSPSLSTEALDFAPGLLAIQESPPARLPHAVMYSVMALFAVLLIWAAVGHVDIIASAPGRLIPNSYVQVVQPADGGIVKDILVHEGQVVQAGQVLVRMDPQDVDADAKTIETQRWLKALQLHRIDSELSGRAMTHAKDAPDDLYNQVQSQFLAHRTAYADARAHAEETLHRAERDYDAASAVLDKLRSTNPILKSQSEAYQDLGKDGYAPQVTVDEKRRFYLENEHDLQAQAATVEGLSSAVAQARQALNELTSKYRSDLHNEQVEAQGAYRKLEQDAAKQLHKSGLLELRAPQSGVIKDLATHTIGTVISAGTVLLSIVPEHAPLVAEIMIENEDVGFVRIQQPVKIKLAAYPFQKYGMIEGDVLQVWPDATDDNNAAQSSNKASTSERNPSRTAYKALVALKTQSLQARGETLTLVSGMAVIAEIEEGRRTVLEYLLSPLQKTLHDSGRER